MKYRKVLAVSAGVASLMSVPALATDGGSGTSVGVMGYVTNVVALASDVWMMVSGNPYLGTCLAAGLVTIGIRIFRRSRKAVGG